MEFTRLSEIDLKSWVNKVVQISGLLVKIEMKMAKNNSTYATIIIKDKGKETEIKWWDFSNNYMQYFIKGEVYAFIVKVQQYKENVSLIVDSKSSGEYLPFSRLDGVAPDYMEVEQLSEWAYSKVNEFIGELSGYSLFGIVKGILDDKYDAFCSYGAASSFHHAGIGGLMVHSASVCELAVRIADMYNELYGSTFINKKLLICGALLHDIGKTEEYDFDKSTGICDYNTSSILETHTISGIKLVAMKAQEFGVSGREVNELIHLIASHHEKPEWGAPIAPHTIEAQILAMADNMDATANRFNRVYKELGFGEGTTEWKAGQKLSYYKSSAMGRNPEL